METIIFERQTGKSLFEPIKAVSELICLHCAKRICSMNVDHLRPSLDQLALESTCKLSPFSNVNFR